jgi:hypothetical protein
VPPDRPLGITGGDGAGTLLRTTATATADANFVARANLTLVKRVIDLDGSASYLVYRKND